MPASKCSWVSQTSTVRRRPASRSTSHQPCRPPACSSAGITSSLTCSIPAARSSPDSPSNDITTANITYPSGFWNQLSGQAAGRPRSAGEVDDLSEPLDTGRMRGLGFRERGAKLGVHELLLKLPGVPCLDHDQLVARLPGDRADQALRPDLGTGRAVPSQDAVHSRVNAAGGGPRKLDDDDFRHDCPPIAEPDTYLTCQVSAGVLGMSST